MLGMKRFLNDTQREEIGEKEIILERNSLINILSNGGPTAKTGDTVNSMGKCEQAFSKVRTTENQHDNYLVTN
jgi:hypothetical protein